jgi:hypothetical protein
LGLQEVGRLAFLRLMVLCELLLIGVVLRCQRVAVFRVVVLCRAFSLLLSSGNLLFAGLLLHIACQFSAFPLGVAVHRVDVVRRHIGVRHLTVFCFVGMQVYHWSMFSGREVVLLTVFFLFVEYQPVYCRVVLVD